MESEPAERDFDARALEDDLRAELRGAVHFDAGARALYATDASNYRQVPIAVVLPRDRDDVIAAVAACRRHGAPIFARGGGTSIPGQCCNAAVVMDLSRHYHRLLELDSDARSALVEPGIVLDDLRDAAERYGLTYGPDPATHTHCTIGGMIGNNSCGVHSVMAGRTVDNVEELDILAYDGTQLRVGRTSDAEYEAISREGGRRSEIYRRLRALRDRYAELIRKNYPRIPRRVSGYSLDELLPENGFHVARALVGSESTCVTVLEARVRLVPSPPARALVVAGFTDVVEAAAHVPEALAHGPIGLEGLDGVFLRDLGLKSLHLDSLRLFPDGDGMLLVEFGGESAEEACAKARQLGRAWRDRGDAVRIVDDPRAQRRIWEVRESGLGATALVPGRKDNWEGWEDSAVAPERLADYLRALRKLLDEHGYHTALYGHFGDGCVHARMDFDLVTAEGLRRWRAFLEEAADLVVKHGGSLSGEHGDGQARGWLLSRMYGDELVEAFREFKAIWDPDRKMNPGKKIDAAPVDANLRLGTAYDPPRPRTHFAFPEDQGNFSRAALRCVGAGICRRKRGGTMCPSYRVTFDEQHSTRGRARLLFEMLQGNPLAGGWRNAAVREALDLCLACKGCKSECPVRVDMATYKAEFMAHYYARRLRPRHAYAFGWIGSWARLAALAPRLAAYLTQSRGLAPLAKRVAGMHPDRTIPVFAPETFSKAMRKRPLTGADERQRVLLWPDTFTDHFHPGTGRAAVAALEHLGFRVELPQRNLCCGRPLYDYGFLGAARRRLRRILVELRAEIRAGVPLVVLEPSCAAVFRDELRNFYPHDLDALRLSRQTFLLAEFLEQYAGDRALPQLPGRALVHGHCHHKALGSIDAEQIVLRRLGLEPELLDSGCCGMAGAFGFEREHYDVSIRCGELVLLPAVRRAPPSTLIVADGFSCREQIAQTTTRRALHLADVIGLALAQRNH